MILSSYPTNRRGNQTMQIFDISLTIHPTMVTYPGDPKPVFTLHNTSNVSNNFQSTKLVILSHIGTHVDAMTHLYRSSMPINIITLESLTGNAIVVDVAGTEKMNIDYFRKIEGLKNSIVILKTNEGSNLEKGIFNEKYLVPDKEISKYLVSQQIKAIGIDSLSIDSLDMVKNHPLFLQENIPIIEGLYLEKVTSGWYFCVCLPLKLKNVDGAPARAILIKF